MTATVLPSRGLWSRTLQFLCGLTSINFTEISRSLTGFTVFAAPPLFFVSLILLLQRRAYGWKVPRVFAIYALLFLGFGLVGGIAGGIDIFMIRQLLAYLVSAIICYVTYSEARRSGFGSSRTALWLLIIYFSLFCLFHLEMLLGIGKGAYYFIISQITANPASAWKLYLVSAPVERFFYLQPEPRVAAIAIFATIIPFMLADYRISRFRSSLFVLLLAFFVAALTNSFTATGFILLSVVFIFSERSAFLAASAFTLLITVVVPGIVGGLVLMGNLETVIRDTLGGRTFGMANAGTLTTTAITIYIAVTAYLSNPIFGLGIGGYARYFYDVVPNMGIAKSGEIVQKLAGEGISSDYVPTPQDFVMKVLAENGLVGALLVLFAIISLYRFAFKPGDGGADRIALRFVVAGIILSWQAYTSFLNPLYWVAAGLIGNIHHRQLISASRQS